MNVFQFIIFVNHIFTTHSQSAQSMDSKVFVWLSPLLHFLLHQSSNSKKPVSMKSLSRPEIQKMIVYFHVKLLWLYRTVNSNRLKKPTATAMHCILPFPIVPRSVKSVGSAAVEHALDFCYDGGGEKCFCTITLP